MGGLSRYGDGGRGRLCTYRYAAITTRMIPALTEMGSDESHFNVSEELMAKVTGQCPQTTTFSKRKESRSRFEPRSFGCLPA